MSKQIVEKSIKHSSRIREYTMDYHKIGFYHNRNIFNCSSRFCGEPIKIGDRVVSKYTASTEYESTRLFHKECAIELNIIVEDE